jgi:hypothetical protein
MLLDMDDMEASCVFYVNVVMFDKLEHSQVCFLDATNIRLVMLTMHHDMI